MFLNEKLKKFLNISGQSEFIFLSTESRCNFSSIYSRINKSSPVYLSKSGPITWTNIASRPTLVPPELLGDSESIALYKKRLLPQRPLLPLKTHSPMKLEGPQSLLKLKKLYQLMLMKFKIYKPGASYSFYYCKNFIEF